MSTNPLFTDAYLDKLKLSAEKYITTTKNILFRREPIDIYEGEAEYFINANVSDIVGISYKGNIVVPSSTYVARDRNLLSVINRNTRGTPIYYFVSEKEFNKIRLWPVPNETLVADPNTINTATGISNQCIISYYYVADENNRLPEYLRRRITKYYVMYLAYRKEGKSQKFNAAEYFKSKFDWSMAELDAFLIKARGAKIMQMNEYVTYRTCKYPHLPLDKFGEEVG